MLCTKIFSLDNYQTWWDEVNIMLQIIAFALRITVSTTIKHTPSQPIFHKDMITRFKTDIDWKLITVQQKLVSVKSNIRENKTRINYKYKITYQVLIFKSSNEQSGHITKLNKNGNVNIRHLTVIETVSL